MSALVILGGRCLEKSKCCGGKCPTLESVGAPLRSDSSVVQRVYRAVPLRKILVGRTKGANVSTTG